MNFQVYGGYLRDIHSMLSFNSAVIYRLDQPLYDSPVEGIISNQYSNIPNVLNS